MGRYIAAAAAAAAASKSKSKKQSAAIFIFIVVVIAVIISSLTIKSKLTLTSSAAIAMATTEIYGVKITRNPSESKLAQLGVTSWPKWGCQPSKFPWTFSTGTETMYLLEGKVKVFVDGHDGSFEIGAGDLVVFSKGMKVTWDVIEAVNKHYSVEE